MARDQRTDGGDLLLWRARRVTERAKACLSEGVGRRQARVALADLRHLVAELDARARHIDQARAASARRFEAVSAYNRCGRLVRK
jgi:hypothetical protein